MFIDELPIVYDNGQLINKQIWSSQYNHSQELFVALENLFSETKLTISDITAIGLALGPGGYSSVRSGVSVGKTIAYTQKIPIFGHNTLDLEASAHQSDEMKICSVIEAVKVYYLMRCLMNQGPALALIKYLILNRLLKTLMITP